jgi:uroporphyrinogen decarboxylase
MEISPMNSRDRIKTLITFHEPDRIGKQDAFWEDTLDRWHAEGMPSEVDAGDYFGFDFVNLYIDASLRLPDKLMEDTPEYTVREDKHGFIAKQWKGKAGALGYLEHRVNTFEDWTEVRGRLDVDFGGVSRINDISYFEPFVEWPSWDEIALKFHQIHQRGKFVLLHVYGPHEANWRKHGFEENLKDMLLRPDLLIDMSRTHVELIIQTLEKAKTFGIIPDGLFMAEDLGVNTGPMFSPKAYRQILFPEHRRLGEYLSAQGITYFIHTDGDVRQLIPMLIEAGVQVLQPMEARAGMDVRQLKKEYGRDLTFMGNISVENICSPTERLEEEVRSKLEVAMVDGGYIYHSDHSIPSSVSLSDYQYLMRLLDRYGQY